MATYLLPGGAHGFSVFSGDDKHKNVGNVLGWFATASPSFTVWLLTHLFRSIAQLTTYTLC